MWCMLVAARAAACLLGGRMAPHSLLLGREYQPSGLGETYAHICDARAR